MTKPQLQEVRIEFRDYVISGKVELGGDFDLQLCGYDTRSEEDVLHATELIAHLKVEDCEASRPSNCRECAACSLGCFVVKQAPVENRLSAIVNAVNSLLGTFGQKVKLTYKHYGVSYIFSAPVEYVGQDMLCVSNRWTYYITGPTTLKVVRGIEGIPGILKVEGEPIPDTNVQALDIYVSPSQEFDLGALLGGVVSALSV